MLAEETVTHRQDVGDKLRRIMESQTPQTIEHALVALRDREDHTNNLPSITVPTLIIVGEHDAITPPAMSEAMTKLIRNPTMVVIKRAGHSIELAFPAIRTVEVST